MTLGARFRYFDSIFDQLENCSGRNNKRFIVSSIPNELMEDWNYIIEVLTGKHKLGYTYRPVCMNQELKNFATVKEVLQFLEEPRKKRRLDQATIDSYIAMTFPWSDYIEPIVNRTIRIGIGNSLLDKSVTSPMLAKKFDDIILKDERGFTITEKLDGNRCIAAYNFDTEKWEYISRNGKIMKVDFDMSGLDNTYIYDGEVLSREQTIQSLTRTDCFKMKKQYNLNTMSSFNFTSGIINSNATDKDLVYNIFDIVSDDPYCERRKILDKMQTEIVNNKTVRILPALYRIESINEDLLFDSLNFITSTGGEGLMINCDSRSYQHCRTNALIKVKNVYTMDMTVTAVELGSGKYEGLIGALYCSVTTPDKKVHCRVGSGISDEERLRWALRPSDIVGKVVEIAYFSLSQDKTTLGTNSYSLRFPRLKKIRTDKETESVD